MKLAVYTVSLPEYTPEEAVAAVKEMGYDAIEWRVDSTAGLPRSLFPKDIDEYAFRYWLDNKATLNVDDIYNACLHAKELCDSADLEIVNLATSLRGDDDRLEAILKAAAAIGCKSIRGPLERYDASKPYAAQFEGFREYLRHVEPLLRKYGIKMLIETHHGMIVSSASSAMRVLDGFDPDYFGLIFDPGNMVYEGFENYQMGFEMLGKYLAHVHIKNAALVPDGEDEFGAVKYKQAWMPLNKGSANLKELVCALVKVGYDGPLSVEDFSNEKPTRDKLEENITYLRQLIAAAQA